MSAPVDDLLRDLAAELAVEPSPSLTVQVRSRVYRPDPRRPVTASALALAVALLTSGFFVVSPSPVTPTARGGQGPPEAHAVRSSRAARLAELPAVAPRLAQPRVVPPRPRALHDARPEGTEMIVPADQAIALQRLLAAMRAGGAPVPPAIAVVVDADGRFPAPRAIEIPEITIEQLLPPGNGGGSRDRK